MMMKIDFTSVIGSCLRSIGVAVHMWRVVAAYGERYLHQVPCASKVLVLCYRSDIQYCV